MYINFQSIQGFSKEPFFLEDTAIIAKNVKDIIRILAGITKDISKLVETIKDISRLIENTKATSIGVI